MRNSLPAERRTWSFWLPVLVALGLSAVLLFVTSRSDATAQSLTVEQINDDLGVGVNLGNSLEGPREGVWGLTLREDYFSSIAQAGFGHVRVPIRFSAYTGEAPLYLIPDGIDPTVPNADNLWDRLDWVIENAENNNLYVILDLHLYDEIDNDVAGERAKFLAIWKQVSERYADASQWVLFELLNEPHGQFNDDPTLLNTLIVDALNVVRASNPTRPVLVGPTSWNQIAALPTFELPADPNLIVSVHFYDPFDFTHQGASWIEPVPPAPATFDGSALGHGAGWGDWSWSSIAVPTSDSLEVTFDHRWAGLAFGRVTAFTPETLTFEVSGTSELSVRCALANDVNTEVTRVNTTTAATTFEIDMTACPANTQSINFMVRSESFDQLNFFQVDLCFADGTCSQLIESGAEAIETAFETAAAWGQANGRPINVGEFGAYSADGIADLADRAEWTEVVRVAGESRGFSMSYWEFGAGFGVYDRTTEQWVQPLVDALGVVEVPPVPTPPPSTISRAGEGCSIVPEGESPISDGYFDVPDHMTAINCALLEYGFDGTAVGCCVSPITVEMSISSPTRVADQLVADAASFEVLETTLSSISGQPAWLFEVELHNQAGATVKQRWLLLSLRWYTLVVVASDDRADIDPARTWASFDELVDSVRVTRIHSENEPNVVAGGRCTGERWTVDVPDGWFHACADGHEIVHLNSSPVSDIAMQCECLGPLWIGDRPFGNYGSTNEELVQEVFDGQSSERSDGTPITIKDYRWGDSYIGTRMFRTVTVHFDDHDVSVTANETTEHTGPFGTWEDTLAAQDALVNSVRLHS